MGSPEFEAEDFPAGESRCHLVTREQAVGHPVLIAEAVEYRRLEGLHPQGRLVTMHGRGMSMGVQLRLALGAAFTEPAADHLAPARAAWPVLARSEHDRVFALFFEANGLAAANPAASRLGVR